jgi:hypothetical protein
MKVRALVQVLLLSLGALPSVALAQRVQLEVRPRPGDTLHVELTHEITLSGAPRGMPDSATTIATTYRVLTRDVVEAADPQGTTVLAIVDSVRMRTTGSIGSSPFPGVDRGMEGVRVRLRLARTGASAIITGLDQLDPELQSMLGAMPAVLPAKPVGVGESWTQDLPLPADGATPAAGGSVRAVFTLDSMTANSDLAWISLRGRLVIATPKPGEAAAAVQQLSGGVTGTLVLDRRRGWITQSRARVTMESLVAVPGGGVPLIVKVLVSQVMRTRPPSP